MLDSIRKALQRGGGLFALVVALLVAPLGVWGQDPPVLKCELNFQGSTLVEGASLEEIYRKYGREVDRLYVKEGKFTSSDWAFLHAEGRSQKLSVLSFDKVVEVEEIVKNGAPIESFFWDGAHANEKLFEARFYCEGPNVLPKSFFQNCKRLLNLTLPSSLKELGDSVFNGCEELFNLSIPSSVAKLGTSVFKDCKALESLAIPEGVTEVPFRAFSGCASLKFVALPSGLTGFGLGKADPSAAEETSEAFAGCSALESLVIPSGVKKLGKDLLKGASGLKALELCGELEETAGVFEGLSSLEFLFLHQSDPTKVKGFSAAQHPSLQVLVPKGAVDDYRKAETWKGFGERIHGKEPVVLLVSERQVGANVSVIYPSGQDDKKIDDNWDAIFNDPSLVSGIYYYCISYDDYGQTRRIYGSKVLTGIFEPREARVSAADGGALYIVQGLQRVTSAAVGVVDARGRVSVEVEPAEGYHVVGGSLRLVNAKDESVYVLVRPGVLYPVPGEAFRLDGKFEKDEQITLSLVVKKFGKSRPLAGASVVQKGGAPLIADRDGKVTLEGVVAGKPIELKVSSFGYMTEEFTIELADNRDNQRVLELAPVPRLTLRLKVNESQDGVRIVTSAGVLDKENPVLAGVPYGEEVTVEGLDVGKLIQVTTNGYSVPTNFSYGPKFNLLDPSHYNPHNGAASVEVTVKYVEMVKVNFTSTLADGAKIRVYDGDGEIESGKSFYPHVILQICAYDIPDGKIVQFFTLDYGNGTPYERTDVDLRLEFAGSHFSSNEVSITGLKYFDDPKVERHKLSVASSDHGRVRVKAGCLLLSEGESGLLHGGEPLVLEVVPDEGYRFKRGELQYTVNGELKTIPIEAPSHIPSMPFNDCSVVVEFEQAVKVHYPRLRGGEIRNIMAGGEDTYLARYNERLGPGMIIAFPYPGYALRPGTLGFRPLGGGSLIQLEKKGEFRVTEDIEVVAEFGRTMIIGYQVTGEGTLKVLSDGEDVLQGRDLLCGSEVVVQECKANEGYRLRAGSLRLCDYSGISDQVLALTVGVPFRIPYADYSYAKIEAIFEKEVKLTVEQPKSGGTLAVRVNDGPEVTDTTVAVGDVISVVVKPGNRTSKIQYLNYKYVNNGNPSIMFISPGAPYFAVPDVAEIKVIGGFETASKVTLKVASKDEHGNGLRVEVAGTVPVVSVESADHGASENILSDLYSGEGLLVKPITQPGYRLKPGSLKYKPDAGHTTKMTPGVVFYALEGTDIKIEAEFEKDAYTLSVVDAPHGKLSASVEFDGSTSEVAEGAGKPVSAQAKVTVSASADAGYRLKAGSLKYVKADDEMEFKLIQPGEAFDVPKYDFKIVGEFELDVYVVAVSATSHGTLSASVVSGGKTIEVKAGEDARVASEAKVTVTATPEDGYRLRPKGLYYLKLDGSAETEEIESGKEFALPECGIEVRAFFEESLYTLTVGDVENGTLSAEVGSAKVDAGKELKGVKPGTTVKVSYTANTGYKLEAGSLKYVKTGVTGDAGVAIKDGEFEAPAYDFTVVAKFEQDSPLTLTYTLTVGKVDNGTLKAIVGSEEIAEEGKKEGVAANTPVKVACTPDGGYKLVAGSLRYVKTGVTGDAGVAITGDEFKAPAYDFTVLAKFALEDPSAPTYSMSVEAVTNGMLVAIVGSNRVEGGSMKDDVVPGSLVKVECTPNLGYKLEAGSLKYVKTGVTGDAGVAIKDGEFEAPAYDFTVKAEFKDDPSVQKFTLTVANVENGTLKAFVGSEMISSGSSKDGVAKGVNIRVECTANAGYRLVAGSLRYVKTGVTGDAGVAITGDEFLSPEYDFTVVCSFEKGAQLLSITLKIGDAQTRAALAGATVQLKGGKSLKSDAKGVVTFTELEADRAYTFTVSLEGYKESEVTVDLKGKTEDVTQAVALDRIAVSPVDADALVVALYPNPVRQTLHIESDRGIGAVSVYSLLGSLVVHGDGSGAGTYSLDLSGLERGVYYVHVEVSGQGRVYRIVKQ